MRKKKLYGLLGALVLVMIVCCVGLYVAFGSRSGDISGDGGKLGQSEQKDSAEDVEGTDGSSQQEQSDEENAWKEDGAEPDASSQQVQDEDAGEIIVRPSQETGTPENSDKITENDSSGSESSEPEGSNESQSENSEQPEDGVIELPFVPID